MTWAGLNKRYKNMNDGSFYVSNFILLVSQCQVPDNRGDEDFDDFSGGGVFQNAGELLTMTEKEKSAALLAASRDVGHRSP